MTQPTQSVPYRLSQAIVAALRAAFGESVVLDNPETLPQLDAQTAPLHLWLEDREDNPNAGSPGQAEGRAFAFGVGVVVASAAARAQADAHMVRAKTVVQTAGIAACRALGQELTTFAAPTEGRRAYKVEGIDVGGAMVFTSFEITYRTRAPAR